MSYSKKLGDSEKHYVQNVIQLTDKNLASTNEKG